MTINFASGHSPCQQWARINWIGWDLIGLDVHLKPGCIVAAVLTQSRPGFSWTPPSLFVYPSSSERCSCAAFRGLFPAASAVLNRSLTHIQSLLNANPDLVSWLAAPLRKLNGWFISSWNDGKLNDLWLGSFFFFFFLPKSYLRPSSSYCHHHCSSIPLFHLLPWFFRGHASGM